MLGFSSLWDAFVGRPKPVPEPPPFFRRRRMIVGIDKPHLLPAIEHFRITRAVQKGWVCKQRGVLGWGSTPKQAYDNFREMRDRKEVAR